MQTVTNCPKCGFNSNSSFSECPMCGVIVDKFVKRESFGGASDQNSHSSDATKDTSGGLAQAPRLSIKQQKEVGEIITGIETRNRYMVMDHFGRSIYDAEEEGGSFITVITRIFLKALRPFTIFISSDDGIRRFTIKRPFRFFFHEIEMFNSTNQPIGTVKKKFSFLRRIYTVYDSNGREIFQLFGPIFRPWTFQIMKNQMEEVGTITKKWSGLFKEAFTDADNFGIQFPEGIDVTKKAILMGAVFLIDHVHFENSGNN